jgi:hypothetical protein
MAFSASGTAAPAAPAAAADGDDWETEINVQDMSDGSTSFVADEMPFEVIPKRQYPHVNRQSAAVHLRDIQQSVSSGRISVCFVRAEFRGPLRKPVHHLLGYDDNPLLVAHDQSSAMSTQYRVISPLSGDQVGYVKSDWRRLRHKVKGIDRLVVTYSENAFGRHGRRDFTVLFEDGRLFVVKPPVKVSGQYVQNFHDIEAVASIRNFVLFERDNFGRDVIAFAKLSPVLYELRVAAPFSLFKAFCLALTAVHVGFFQR